MNETERRRARDVAVRAVREAGAAIRRHFAHMDRLAIEEKAEGELVSAADRDAEEIIRRLLADAYPDHRILGEEHGESGPPSPYCWYVDPIDGTTNFLHGNIHFAVSVALAYEGTVLVGAIFHPTQDTLYTGVRGAGAFRNRARMRVNAREGIRGSTLMWCGGHERDPARRDAVRAVLKEHGGRVTRIGSAALECAAVAAGLSPAYVTLRIHPWDVAAGSLLVEEAGGAVSDFHGNPYALQTGDFLVSNGRMHDALVRLLVPYAADPRHTSSSFRSRR